MRLLIAIVLTMCIGCNEHGKHPAFDAAPSDAAIDRDAGSCDPSGTCAAGPACGLGCCAAGEHCVQGVCMCAFGAACTGGDMCNVGGPGPRPFAEPHAVCGNVCCGGQTGCPI